MKMSSMSTMNAIIRFAIPKTAVYQNVSFIWLCLTLISTLRKNIHITECTWGTYRTFTLRDFFRTEIPLKSFCLCDANIFGQLLVETFLKELSTAVTWSPLPQPRNSSAPQSLRPNKKVCVFRVTWHFFLRVDRSVYIFLFFNIFFYFIVSVMSINGKPVIKCNIFERSEKNNKSRVPRGQKNHFLPVNT